MWLINMIKNLVAKKTAWDMQVIFNIKDRVNKVNEKHFKDHVNKVNEKHIKRDKSKR